MVVQDILMAVDARMSICFVVETPLRFSIFIVKTLSSASKDYSIVFIAEPLNLFFSFFSDTFPHAIWGIKDVPHSLPIVANKRISLLLVVTIPTKAVNIGPIVSNQQGHVSSRGNMHKPRTPYVWWLAPHVYRFFPRHQPSTKYILLILISIMSIPTKSTVLLFILHAKHSRLPQKDGTVISSHL